MLLRVWLTVDVTRQVRAAFEVAGNEAALGRLCRCERPSLPSCMRGLHSDSLHTATKSYSTAQLG